MISLTPVLRFALLLVRPGMLMLVAPGFGGTYAPARVKIGLTATPALHTVNIFGDPVFKYSYREAVIDGYLSA